MAKNIVVNTKTPRESLPEGTDSKREEEEIAIKRMPSDTLENENAESKVEHPETPK